MTRILVSCYLSVSLLFVAAQQMTSNGNVRTDPRTLVTTGDGQVMRGADLYFAHCSVCHGDTALGLAEAKTTFPEEDRKCTRCHRPGNPTLVNWTVIEDNNMFDIGEPAALRGDGALTGFPDAGALYTYVKTTMPRYQPGALKDEAYLDITAFLAYINGALPEGTNLTEQSAPDISIP